MNGLNIEMQEIKGTATTETLLKSILQEAIKCCIPHKTARAKTNKPWITPDLLKLTRKRGKMKNSGSQELKAEVGKLT